MYERISSNVIEWIRTVSTWNLHPEWKENKTQKFVCKYEDKMYLFRFLYLAQIYNVAILTL